MDIYDLIPTDLNIYDALDLLRPVAVYIGGMTVYAVFVFTFYRFVASRDMFAMDLSKYEQSRFQFVRSLLHVIMYIAKYIILFPVFAFFWFAVVTLILAFLAKDQSFSQVLLMGLATVGTIRVSAYINEDLSRDLAKMLPFAVLGLFLINTSFFQIEDSLVILNESMTYLDNILYYLAFLIALEFALRLIMAILMFVIAMTKLIFRKPVPAAKKEPEESPPPEADDEMPAPPDEDEAEDEEQEAEQEEAVTIYGGPQTRGAARGAGALAPSQRPQPVIAGTGRVDSGGV